ncbi:MAG TPA: RHS repeat-associated core domain-containing protein, partial [Terrimicrobiaceae bacterium]
LGQAIAASAKDNRFLFTGREWLAELGLYDYRNRIYSPDLGRFLQADPIGFAGDDANLYRYVANSPINAVDPLGLDPSGDGHDAVDRIRSGLGNTYGFTPEQASALAPDIAMGNRDFLSDLTTKMDEAWNQNPSFWGPREVGFTVCKDGSFSDMSYGDNSLGIKPGLLGTSRPEPPGTIWGFHTHPFSGKGQPSYDGDIPTANRLGRPESMIGTHEVGTYNPATGKTKISPRD